VVRITLPVRNQQFQIQKSSIDYVPIPPAAQARASKGTRLNPAGSFSSVLSTLEGGFLTSPPLTRGWVKSGVSQFPNLELLLYQADVHLIELDLLRRGTRPFDHPRLPAASYFVTLTRARSAAVDRWPIALQQSLPIIPVPLKGEDMDVALDLGIALTEIYAEAGYDLSIDYAQAPPPPALTEADQTWLRSR
jgi:Protein of unknown function (DUF4058)